MRREPERVSVCSGMNEIPETEERTGIVNRKSKISFAADKLRKLLYKSNKN